MPTFATINSQYHPCLVHKKLIYRRTDIVCDSEYIFSLVSKPIKGYIYIAIGTKTKFYRLRFNIANKKLELSYVLDATNYEFHKSKIGPNKDKIYICNNNGSTYQWEITHQISFPQFLIDPKVVQLQSDDQYKTNAYRICMKKKYIIRYDMFLKFGPKSRILSYDPAIIYDDELIPQADDHIYKINNPAIFGKSIKKISIPDGILGQNSYEIN